jgi:hypothetical protein
MKSGVIEGCLGAVAVAALVLGFASVAGADNIIDEVQATVPADTIAAGGSLSVSYHIVENNTGGISGCDASDGSPVTVTIVVPAGVTATPSTLTFSLCANGAIKNDQAVVLSSNTPGDYSIGVSTSDTHGDYNTNPSDFTLHVTGGVDVDDPPTVDAGGPYTGVEGSPTTVSGTVVDPDSTPTLTWSYAPVSGVDAGATCAFDDASLVSTDVTCTDDGTYSVTLTADDGVNPAVSDSADLTVSNANPVPTIADAPTSGPEGTAISLTSSVTDAGSNDTVASYAWSVTKDGNAYGSGGSLSGFSFTPDDNATYVVTLDVTDDDGGPGTTSATITVTNVNPTVYSMSLTNTGPCTATVSASFSDPGTADTHTASIDWGDTSSSVGTVSETLGSGTVSGGPHLFNVTSSSVTVTVTDDDLGSGSASATFSGNNVPSNFLPPINTGAGVPRSVFKLGSTIPVKITVTDCSGASITTLTPTVQLLKVDNVPDGSANEAGIAEIPTNGKSMRWNGTQYIYNLSTKNSQFTVNGSTTLTKGSYKLYVTDPSFFGGIGPIVYFDLT